MTYFPITQIKTADSPSVDAFSRWRVSEPKTLFASSMEYGRNALFWEYDQDAGTVATFNYAAADSHLELTTTDGTTGAYITLQSKAHHRYEPGKSQIALITFTLIPDGSHANLTREIGYASATNGYVLTEADGVVYITERAFGGDVSVAQSLWNIDPMDGSGPSGVTINWTKSQIFVLDCQWLGVGRVRCGLSVDGVIHYFHEYNHANSVTSPYNKSMSLPVRANITNQGVTDGEHTLKFICASVSSESGYHEENGIQFSHNVGATGVGVTTRRPILSLRAKTTGPNSVTNYGQIIAEDVDLMATTNPHLWELVLNGTLTSPSWAAFNATYSIAEVDTAATGISGGLVLASGYTPAAGAVRGVSGSRLFERFPLVYAALTPLQDTLSVVITSVSSTSTSHAAITWRELY